MGRKAAKSTRKFAASGQLKKTIQNRKKHQQLQKKAAGRRGASNREFGKGKGKAGKEDEEEDGEADREEVIKPVKQKGKSAKGMSVDDLLGAGFMDDDEDDASEASGSDLDSEPDQDEDDSDIPSDNDSFASIDDLDDEGQTHLNELSALAQKDPEFYKYLQENDRELLDFNPGQKQDVDVDSDEEEDGGFDMEGVEAGEQDEDRLPPLTMGILKGWQKALLEQRSLRALRKLLIAFRSAAHMNEDDQVLAWSIDSSSVYNKLVTTTFKYTPIVLEHHVPYKTLPNGKFKPPTQTPKQKALQKLILSYFHNIIHILSQLTENETLQLALTESAKIVPYVIGSRKAVRAYLKTCLELWASADDSVRIAAFLSIRKLASSTDESIMDIVLKNTYLTLIRSVKSTSTYTLPSINLMKNSASEIFCVDHAVAYQHAFGYIRQLAIHLRGSMKVKTKEAYKQVYNWQYVHCVDFWSIVLARACDTEALAERGGVESELKPLLYPLVQVSLGAIKLISNGRSYPFHLQIARSLLHLTRHTRTYIPLPPYILPILTSTLTPSTRPKNSTLKPLDFDVHIRTPQQYLKTRVYSEGLVEEAAYLLAEWLASKPIQGSIAFPELVIPLVVVLRKALKSAKSPSHSKNSSGKDVGVVKGLVERIEESGKWVEQRRTKVKFGPGMLGEVGEWEENLKIDETPLAKYLKVQRKAREKRKQLVDKARQGEDEILED